MRTLDAVAPASSPACTLRLPPRPHLLIDLHGCDPARLNDCAGCRDLLYATARGLGATTLGDFFHQFSPWGVTGIIAIAESHVSIHTWVEEGYAAVDLFLCNSMLSQEMVSDAVDRLRGFLGAGRVDVRAVQRGRQPDDLRRA